MEKRSIKICPLARSGAGTTQVNCMQWECAWWVKPEGECALELFGKAAAMYLQRMA